MLRAGARVRRADRAAHAGDAFRGSGDLRGFFRKPFGPGWALVGDAGYHKHPITAFGITDAFRDAEALAAWSVRRTPPYDDAMAAWQRARDEESLPMYGFTCDFATLEPPPPEMQQLLGAVTTTRRRWTTS